MKVLQHLPLRLHTRLWFCVAALLAMGAHAEPAGDDPAIHNALYRLTLPDMMGSTPAPPPLPTKIPYQKLVKKSALKYRLDAALLHAVIEVESNHSATAVSPMGALGLMQVLPDTGRRYGAHDLFNPAQNVNAGAAYLRWLLDRYDQNLDLALAAYNAGEGAVDRYGRKIPRFRETQRYVPKVRARYDLLMGRDAVKPEAAASSSPYRLDPAALKRLNEAPAGADLEETTLK